MTGPADGNGEGGRVRPIAIVVCALAAVATMYLPLGLAEQPHIALAIVVAIGGLWMTEALPLGVTALLVPVLATAAGVGTAKESFAGFGDPIVFLFFGTFLLTDAASQHGLDRRIADAVTTSAWVRASPRRLLFAIGFLGCALSAWMNNTATTAMLLPLAMTAGRMGSRPFLVSVLLLTAYAPSLGGLATPVGTAPNLIGIAKIEAFTNERIGFARWMLAFAPLAVVATAGTALWLSALGGRVDRAALPAVERARRPWTAAERRLVTLFAAVVLLWIAPGTFGGLLGEGPWRDEAWAIGARAGLKAFGERLPEACVPVAGGILLFVLPAGSRGGPRLAQVSAFGRLDWSTILLFGGGISLGSVMERTGLATALGRGLFDAFRDAGVDGAFGITLAAVLMAVVVSEFTSNTASAALVVPVVLPLAQAAGMDPVGPALAATVGCSFGFMLPVSTPPNAIVYGTGKIRIGEMVRRGVVLDIAGAVLVAAWVTLLL